MFSYRKKFILLILCAIISITSGCYRAPQIKKSVSLENFSKYELKYREISDKYKLAMNELESPLFLDGDDAGDVCKKFSLSRNNTVIEIYFSNDALDFEKEGEETFLISYILPINEEYDLDLFAELVNAVSGREISAEYCEDFLRKLDVIDRQSRSKKEEFSQSKTLDFEERWTITYSLKGTVFRNGNLEEQELQFSGLTNAIY